MTLVDQLVTLARAHATNAFDAAAAIAELHQLARGDHQALEQAIPACLAQPASLATRRRAIEFLGRLRYEDPLAT